MSEKIKVRIVCCAYSSAVLIKRFWESLKPHFDDPRLDLHLYLAIHGGWQDVRIAAYATLQEIEGHITVAETDNVNPGLAYSWNNAIVKSYDGDDTEVVIIANDDLEFDTDDIYTLASVAAAAQPNVYAVFALGTHAVHGPGSSMGHSLFAYTKAAYKKLGCFDENFFPAYCEDQDIAIRAEIAKMDQMGVQLNCKHTGSAHVRGVFVPAERLRAIQQQNPITQHLNMEYLERKWPGFHAAAQLGKPFTNACPFNETDEAKTRCLYHPYYIPASERHNPYPAHFRSDRSMVKI